VTAAFAASLGTIITIIIIFVLPVRPCPRALAVLPIVRVVPTHSTPGLCPTADAAAPPAALPQLATAPCAAAGAPPPPTLTRLLRPPWRRRPDGLSTAQQAQVLLGTQRVFALNEGHSQAPRMKPAVSGALRPAALYQLTGNGRTADAVHV
jgi:hypothetical protein